MDGLAGGTLLMLHPLSVLALALVALVPIPHRPGATVQVLPAAGAVSTCNGGV